MDKEMTMEGLQGMQEAGEVTAQELGAQLGAQSPGEAAHTQQEEAESAVREGVGELFEDGWTMQELTAFSQDPIAREAIAQGKSVARAACIYLRAHRQAPRKSGVPTAKAIATGGYDQGNPIEHMTDEEFDAFSRRAHAAAMSGKKVRI